MKNAQFSLPVSVPVVALSSSSVRPIESRRARCDNALAVLPRTTRRERRARSSRSIVAHSRPVARRRRRLVEPPPTDRPTDRPTFHTCIRAYVHTYYIGLCRVSYGRYVRRQHVTRCWRDLRRASRVGRPVLDEVYEPSTSRGEEACPARGTSETRPRRLARVTIDRSIGLDRSVRSIDRWSRSIGVDAAVVRAGCARVRWRRRSRARRR